MYEYESDVFFVIVFDESKAFCLVMCPLIKGVPI